jgi:hypothetical protein
MTVGMGDWLWLSFFSRLRAAGWLLLAGRGEGRWVVVKSQGGKGGLEPLVFLAEEKEMVLEMALEQCQVRGCLVCLDEVGAGGRLREKRKIKRWGAGGCLPVRGEKIRLLGFLFLCCLSPQISKLPPSLKIQCSMVFIGKVLLGFQTSPSTFPFLLFSSFFCKF